jgi:nucleotide-binding universal stress UspA family protein
MFRKMLIPHGGSEAAGAVLPVARAIARASGAEILLLRVIHGEFEGPTHYLTEQTHQSLERIRGELALPGLSVRTIVRHGDPAEQILDAARTEHVDVIAMTTYGLAGIDRLLMGSVAEQVLAKSAAAVLLVRPGGRRPRHLRSILVPIDGSAGAALALGAALPLARSSGATLTLLDVAPPVRAGNFQVSEAGELGRDLRVGQAYEEAGRVRAEDYVKRMTERLRAREFRATGLARTGAPAEVIVATATECHADLIVMSTHARTGPARAILGSVADAVVHLADRPVLLVRRDHRLNHPAQPPAHDMVPAFTDASEDPTPGDVSTGRLGA